MGIAGAGRTFSGFSVSDVERAREFYGERLGVPTSVEHGMLWLHPSEGHDVLAYPKGEGHVPASYTVLNFEVADVAAAVADLRERGVEPQRFDGVDDDGVFRRGGPLIAWFTDPDGNVFSVLEAR